MYKIIRALPYIILFFMSTLIYFASKVVENIEVKTILFNVLSNAIFFLFAFIFYDIVKQIIFNKEKRYINEYIKNQISNDIFVVLYYLKKVINGYNLETNTVENILNQCNYSRREIENSIKNQNYIGFQIFKQIDEIRDIFKNVLTDNFILKYSSHIEMINILKLNNLLGRIEFLLKNESNYIKSPEKAFEFTVVNGKDINPQNDEKYLLTKKTPIQSRFVVYDSGYFDVNDIDKLLNRYVLKKESAILLSNLLFELFLLIKYWIPKVVILSRNEKRFRIIKDYLSPYTKTKTTNSKIYIADIIDMKQHPPV